MKKERNRLTNEPIAPGSAYATDAQIEAVLKVTQKPPRTIMMGGRTVTVSEPIEGIGEALDEQMKRGSLPVRQRPKTFGGKCID